MCDLLAFRKTLRAYSIFSSMFALSSFLWWIAFFVVEEQAWAWFFSLFKLIHHISTVILRRLRLDLLLQYSYLLFKSLDFKLQVIILFTYSFIIRFYNNLLNILLLPFCIKSININVIVSFITIASRGFGSFGCAWRFWIACPKSIKLHFKIFMSLLQSIIRILKSTNWALETRDSFLTFDKFLIFILLKLQESLELTCIFSFLLKQIL
jgi:hypothetical protein